MRILTTTLCYPTPQAPEQGIFILRRAAAVAKCPQTEVQVVAPQPWCPLLRTAPSGTRPNQSRDRKEACEKRATPQSRDRKEAVPPGSDKPLYSYNLSDEATILCPPPPVHYPRMLSAPVLGWATDGLAFAHALTRFVHHAQTHGQGNFDLIDAHFVYPDGVGAWLAGRKLGIPVAVTVRGKIVSLSRRTLRRWQIHLMLRGVAARIAVSESLARWVHKVGGSDLHVDVIPNGVDAAVFHPVDRQQTRAALGWEPTARYILSVGHLQRLKGFDRIVAAMPAVRAALGDVQLVLAGSRRGEPAFQKELMSRIAEVNRAAGDDADNPCVRFLGPVPAETLNNLYNAADLTVSPSRSEGWCNTISESLAVGTPVVATDVGGNREQIVSPTLGTIVPDGDGKALSEAVTAALLKTWDRSAITQHGAARDWQHTARQVHEVFTRVLNANPLREPRTRTATADFEPPRHTVLTSKPRPFASTSCRKLAASQPPTDLFAGDTP